MIENLEVAVAANRSVYPGPVPTLDEIRAARDRLSLHVDGDVEAARGIAHRLAQLAGREPYTAYDIAAELSAVVATLADRHAGCVTVGCWTCLYLADAGAIARAWEPR